MSTAKEEDIKEFYDQSPDRALAIALPAIIENRMTSILQAVMRDDKKAKNELFRSSGALGSFGTKVSLAYMLDLISARLYRDLRILIKIRNAFAHKLEIKRLDQHPIDDWIKGMTVYETLKRVAAEPVDYSAMSPIEITEHHIFQGAMQSTREGFRECVRIMIHSLFDYEQRIRALKAANKRD